MKFFFKLLLVAAVVVFIKTQFIDNKNDFKHRGLVPLDVRFVQGPKPAENHPLLIEFWATWCGPCRQSIPHVNELYAKYHSRGLYVVGITQEEPGVVQSFMQQVPMQYAVGLDPLGRYGKELEIKGIPHAFLLNRNGMLVWDGHPMELTAAEVEKVL